MHIEINFILPDGTKVENKPEQVIESGSLMERSDELHKNCLARIDAANEVIKRLQAELTELRKVPRLSAELIDQVCAPLRPIVPAKPMLVNCEAFFGEDVEGFLMHTHSEACAAFVEERMREPIIPESLRELPATIHFEAVGPITMDDLPVSKNKLDEAFELFAVPAEPLSYQRAKAASNAQRAQLVCPKCEETRQAMAFRSKNAAGDYVRHDTCSTCRNGGLAPGKKLCDKCKVGKGLQSFVDKVGVKHETCGSCRAGIAPIEGPMQTPEAETARKIVREIIAERKTTNGPVTTIKMHDGSQIDLSQREQICDECKASVDTSKEPYIGGLCIQCTTPELRAAARKHAQSTFQKWREKDELIDCSPEN